jgi:hypothetical protein
MGGFDGNEKMFSFCAGTPYSSQVIPQRNATDCFAFAANVRGNAKK